MQPEAVCTLLHFALKAWIQPLKYPHADQPRVSNAEMGQASERKPLHTPHTE